MKKLMIVLVMCISLTLGAQAQKKVVMDKSGNFVSLTAGKTTKVADKTTGKFFIDTKGVKYPVYESVNGKFYYLKTAKSGNIYKVYIVAK